MQMLFEAISGLLENKGRAIVAIDGSCAAGKTTLAKKLNSMFDCNVIHMDDFFLRPEQRTEKRLGEVGGNVDYERFFQEVLQPLLAGADFAYRPYDCRTCALIPPVAVKPKKLTIVEGSYSHHPYFGDAYDLRVFLTVEPQVRAERLNLRPQHIRQRFFDEWIPMEQRYFAGFGIREKADLVLDTLDE